MGTVALSETAKTWNTKCSALMSNYDGKSAGLYIVDNTNKVRKANVKVSCSGNTWSFSDGTSSATLKSLFSPSYHYFLYYPYQENSNTVLGGLPTVGTTVDANKIASANAFFESLQSAWTPSSNQGTQANLNANDLQISKGYVSDDASSINFDMDHTMVLADLTLGTTKSVTAYHLSTDKSYAWTGAPIDVTAKNEIDGRTMYKISSDHYAMVVKPNDLTFKCSGNRGWDLSLSLNNTTNIANGIAYSDAYPYVLEVGDIYYSDGALTHQSEDLASGKTPIGIVGYIGSNYWTEKDTKAKGIGGHALVMCLKNIGSTSENDRGTYFYWYPSKIDAGRTKITTTAMIRESADKTYGSGYTETIALANMSTDYEAVVAAKNYTNLPANSDKCTGWFLPSAGQYYAIMSQLGGGINPDTWSFSDFFGNGTTISGNINKALTKVGTKNYTSFFRINDNTWTSSQVSSTEIICFDSGIDDGKAVGSIRFGIGNYIKSRTRSVRPFLAF